MKKFICISFLVLMMTAMLTACGKFECDLCGEEKSGKKYNKEVDEEKITICEDCNEDLEKLEEAFN